MIRINSMHFSNILSYGEGNLIRFNDKVLQLVGINGAGKSSIPLILEEALYNKNSKGVKKADLLNKFNGAKSYSISVQFNVENDHYFLGKTVGSTTKVKLTRNDEDISGHTTTQTYKLIEGIIGVDYTTFSKLVYQSMGSSLDFISATDTTRKKFLISLLGLEMYVEKETTLKAALKENQEGRAKLEGTVNTYKTWLSSHAKIPEKIPLIGVVPANIAELESQLAELSSQLSNILYRNKMILANKEAKIKLDSIVHVEPQHSVKIDETLLSVKKQSLDRDIRIKESEISKLKAVKDKCYVCGHTIDIGDTLVRLGCLEQELNKVKALFTEADLELESIKLNNSKVTKYENYLKELENAQGRYDVETPIEPLDSEALFKERESLNKLIAAEKERERKEAVVAAKVVEHNNLVDYQTKQLKEYEASIELESSKLMEASETCDRLATLVASMGTKGLIAFKIESMVKVFEELINEYLQELSDGRFTLKFDMDDTKLQIVVFSDSTQLDIKSLSSGEFNKVNTATLLAVRKMLTSISKVDINLLFLDEVVSVLDAESKDTLIELLLKEPNLNTVVVSHGYTHPLAETLNVVKENKMSRLEI